MQLRELVERLDLEVLVGSELLDREISCGYASDLLSDVMGNAPENSVWVTLQIHQNVVAVVLLRSIAAVVLVGGRRLEPAVAEKAAEEGTVFLSSKLSAFELVGRMYQAGIEGSEE